MKTYNEYYEAAGEECRRLTSDREMRFGQKWWDKNRVNDKVNDMPIIENTTGVMSSEFVTLHHMIMSLLIDYVREYPLDNEVWGYSIDIELVSGNWKAYFYSDDTETDSDTTGCGRTYGIQTYSGVKDRYVIDSYDTLNERIYFFVSDFIRRHREHLDDIFTRFMFTTTGLIESLDTGRWMPETDSTMSLYVGDTLAVCSM